MATLSRMHVRLTRQDPWPLVGVLCALAFLVIAALVVRHGSLPLDEPIADLIQGLPIPRVVWEFCSGAGGSTVAVIGVSSVVIAALVDRPRLAIILALTMLASVLFTDIVKELVERPRPPGADLVETSGWSFPSSHALSCTTTYGLLAVVVWRTSLPRRLRLAALAAGVVVPILVGLSRVGLDVHYPSDVLAGWLAGVAFVALAATLITVTAAMDQTHLRRSRGRSQRRADRICWLTWCRHMRSRERLGTARRRRGSSAEARATRGHARGSRGRGPPMDCPACGPPPTLTRSTGHSVGRDASRHLTLEVPHGTARDQPSIPAGGRRAP